jgi:hypothetical protein
MAKRRASSSKLPTRPCRLCGQAIAPARLEALPDTDLCIECAKKNPPPKIDPRKLDLSEASQIDRTGFAPND